MSNSHILNIVYTLYSNVLLFTVYIQIIRFVFIYFCKMTYLTMALAVLQALFANCTTLKRDITVKMNKYNKYNSEKNIVQTRKLIIYMVETEFIVIDILMFAYSSMSLFSLAWYLLLIVIHVSCTWH